MKNNKQKNMKRSPKNGIKLSTFLLYTAAAINQLASFFSRDNKLHNARFAKLSEMLALYGAAEDHDTSLLLGIGHMNHMIRVRPKKTRSELGNLLVVAPTRGGKGLMAVAQLLSWRHTKRLLLSNAQYEYKWISLPFVAHIDFAPRDIKIVRHLSNGLLLVPPKRINHKRQQLLTLLQDFLSQYPGKPVSFVALGRTLHISRQYARKLYHQLKNEYLVPPVGKRGGGCE